MTLKEKLKKRLDFIYKSDFNDETLSELVTRIEHTKNIVGTGNEKWSENDIILITYGDTITSKSAPSLFVLKGLVNQYLKDVISYIHILPFYPYSSDDGFSVIDYKKVNPELGDWNHIKGLSGEYKLMFDLVINHISQYSEWFQNYLKGIHPGKDFFIEADPNQDLSMVVRPRSLPLLTKAETSEGAKHVWTTFSSDQIDLNFSNPELLVKMVEIFLFYLEQGASMIRLDAIAFLWKKTGTNCLHLEETHEFVKILRDITDHISPHLILLTETNVPNKENLSYFGDNDEANMVYQFSLPPLLVHTLFSGSSEHLSKWAGSIPSLTSENTFFNFTASHDGIGVRPLEGLLPTEDFNALVDGMKNFGGEISTKTNPDGSNSPYEMNITYFDAMKGTTSGEDSLQIERFICSQTIMISMQGVPAFYIHSLLGTRNYYEGVEETGMKRTINRRKWEKEEILTLLEDENSHHSKVLQKLTELIKLRRKQPAFHPNASQKIIALGNEFFGLSRNNGELYSISNITNKVQRMNLTSIEENKSFTDIISEKNMTANEEIEVKPYQTLWLTILE